MAADIGMLVKEAKAQLHSARLDVAYKFGVPAESLKEDSDVSDVIRKTGIGAGAPVAYNWRTSLNLSIGQKIASGEIKDYWLYEGDSAKIFDSWLAQLTQDIQDNLPLGASVYQSEHAALKFLQATVMRARIGVPDAGWDVFTSLNHRTGQRIDNVDLWRPGTDSHPDNWIASYNGDPTLGKPLDPHVHLGFEQYWTPGRQHLSVAESFRVLTTYKSGGLEGVKADHPGFEFREAYTPPSRI